MGRRSSGLGELIIIGLMTGILELIIGIIVIIALAVTGRL